MGNSFAEKINNTKVMLAGLEANLEKLARRGMDQAFIDRLRGVYEEACAIDNTHEALKARLKETTAQLNAKMTELNQLFQEAKKVVKLETVQESWKEYGFADKR
jgi:seryl-tRNA synthetase